MLGCTRLNEYVLQLIRFSILLSPSVQMPHLVNLVNLGIPTIVHDANQSVLICHPERR